MALIRKRKNRILALIFKTSNSSAKRWVVNSQENQIYNNLHYSQPGMNTALSSTKHHGGGEVMWGSHSDSAFSAGLEKATPGAELCVHEGNDPSLKTVPITRDKHALKPLPFLYLDDFREFIERVLAISTVFLSQLQDVAIHTG